MAKNIKKNDDRREILIELKNIIDKYNFEGDINKVAEYIKSIPKKLKADYPLNIDYKNAHRFSIRQDSEYEYYNNDKYDTYILQIYRWETDEELNSRKALNKKFSEAAKLRELKKKESSAKRKKTLYESLKKEFENK